MSQRNHRGPRTAMTNADGAARASADTRLGPSNAASAASATVRADETVRDLLADVEQRLRVVAAVQAAEARATQPDAQRHWASAVADPHHPAAKPEPTRWHDLTRLLLRAGEALARGDLVAGASLLRRAHEAQEALHRATTSVVGTLPGLPDPPPSRVPAGGAPTRSLPLAIRQLVEDILDERAWVADPPARRVRPPARPREEEEADDDDAANDP